MLTKWGLTLDKNNVLPEYPRPQMVRGSYINLNGSWDYAITQSDKCPENWDGGILVPFSPESELSGVGRQLSPNEYLWYRRTLDIPQTRDGERILLHFGAVDQCADVYIGDRLVGLHIGGYTPFTCDITDAAADSDILTVRVRDVSDTSCYSRGKQKLDRGGIWYTAQSGIWQTVWMEVVPREYISALRITPLFDESRVEIVVVSDCDGECVISMQGEDHRGRTNTPISVSIPGFTAWTPENPYLYEFSAQLVSDRVDSYFGMRKFSVERDDMGVRRLFLNGRPYFHTGLLDQGYYCDGLYTAPSDEAMIYDITLAKNMGFNMLRKHIKIEPLRWYYHCDRLGMLVWQDMINGGGEYDFLTVSAPVFLGGHARDSRYRKFARTDASGREMYYRELREMINGLYNCACIAMWVPFNEGWGQFDAAKAVDCIREIDQTRTIDHASGWYDQRIGDISSLHVYFRRYRYHRDRLNRAVVLSEFGGYNYYVKDHSFGEKIDSLYSKYKSPESLLCAFRRLYERQIIPAKAKGLSACVYTQLTDVEDELNGMVTYDRDTVKLPIDAVREINDRLRDE